MCMMMDHCEYKPVQEEGNTIGSQKTAEDHGQSWNPFLRQLLVSTTVWTQYFQCGLCFGAPTVIIPYMREDKGEDYVSQEMASWMSSAMSYAATPWPPIIATLATIIGRRSTVAIGAVTAIVGFAVLCAVDSPRHVLVGMILQGPLAGLQMTVSLLVLTEYTSPQYRGVFLAIKSASVFWGIWVANAIGTVAHWHYIAWMGIACGVYNIGTLFLWPESPYWLASKGRLQQCKTAHRWLKGHDKSNENDLQELLRQHQRSLSVDEKQSETGKWKLWYRMKSKGFYKPLLLNATLFAQYHMSGKMVYSVYAIDIIKDITKSKSDAYTGMLILDAVTLLGMYAGCGFAKRFQRRTLLFTLGTVSIVLLLILSAYLFFVKFEFILEDKFVTIFLLTCFSISISSGPVVLNCALGAELLPLRLRSTCTTIIAIYLYVLLGTNLKMAPCFFSNLGLHGTFLLYALISGTCLLLLYIYLPETKDKTLIEIEKLIIGTKPEDEYKFEELDKIKHDG